MMLNPCFAFRPDIFARACWRKLKPRPERCLVRTAWGDWLEVEPRKFIGANIYMRGIHELAVCEVLWRLAKAGELALDVGANIGLMTSLLSKKVGERGNVLAFEAHPKLFNQLERNAKRWNRPGIRLLNLALSDSSGQLILCEGRGFAVNEGTARIGVPGSLDRCYEVESIQLDDVLKTAHCGVAKIDVEGHEVQVLLGATGVLAEQRLRDVVFESTWSFPAEAHELLFDCGYCLFEIRQSWRGPQLRPVCTRSGRTDELADYLATADPQRSLVLISSPGWQVLKRRSA